MTRINQHLDEVGESYFEHMAHATRFGARMIVSGVACLIHAFIPSLCVKTGSEAINELHDRMVVNRVKPT